MHERICELARWRGGLGARRDVRERIAARWGRPLRVRVPVQPYTVRYESLFISGGDVDLEEESLHAPSRIECQRCAFERRLHGMSRLVCHHCGSTSELPVPFVEGAIATVKCTSCALDVVVRISAGQNRTRLIQFVGMIIRLQGAYGSHGIGL